MCEKTRMPFSELFEDATKQGIKLQTASYLREGRYPIIDQGQEQIAGYTDEVAGVFDRVPCIVFGDHTRIIKYIDQPFFLGADGVKVLCPKAQKDNVKYLFYALQTVKIPDTGYNRHFKWLKESNIVVYSSEQQDRIVATLDKIEKLISQRKKQLQKLDDLIKSRFVEMFGDPLENPKKWNEVSIASIINGNVSNGFFAKRDDYQENGNVSVLGVAYVVNRLYSQVFDLPKTDATQKDIQRYSVKNGDLLFCRSSLVAEGIGKASIVPENVPKNVLFECHVIRLPLDLAKCVPEYVQVLTTTDYYRKQIIAQSKTATMTTIGQDGILKTKILLPPIERQQDFYSLLNKIEKLKIKAEQGLEKLEQMKQALMQKYFG